MESTSISHGTSGQSHTTGEEPPLRGRERVLASARALLDAFEFFHTRVRVAMICWTMGQQAFNASMILTLSLLNPVPKSAAAAEAARNDYYLVHRTYSTFVEMHQKGIHRLAGVACSKLSALLMKLHPPPSQFGGLYAHPTHTGPEEKSDTVMGSTGMILLEDPGLQGFVDEEFSPLGFQFAGGNLATQGMGIGSPGWSARAAPGTSIPPTMMTAGPMMKMMGGSYPRDSSTMIHQVRGSGPTGYSSSSVKPDGLYHQYYQYYQQQQQQQQQQPPLGEYSIMDTITSREPSPPVGPKPEVTRQASGSRA